MDIRALDHLSPPRWPVALQQHPLFARALQGLGIGNRALAWSDGITSGEVLLMQKTFGPLVFELASRAHLTASAAEAIAAHGPQRWPLLAVTPEVSLPVRGALPVFSATHVAEWDLTRSHKARQAGLTGPWRTALKKASRGKLKVSRTLPNASVLADLFVRDRAQQSNKAYRALPPTLILAIHQAMPSALQLWQARLSGDLVAEALIVVHAPAATYQIGWSSEAGRDAQAMNLILWRASETLADIGIERFDLGQIATDRAPGLARFKLGTGAEARPLGPTLFFGPLTGVLGNLRRSASSRRSVAGSA